MPEKEKKLLVPRMRPFSSAAGSSWIWLDTGTIYRLPQMPTAA